MKTQSKRIMALTVWLCVLALAALACQVGAAQPTATPPPTVTPRPTLTPKPTDIPPTAPATKPDVQSPSGEPDEPSGDSEAIGIVAQFETAMQELKTMHFAMNISTKATGMELAITGDGFIELPDKSYMTMDVLGNEMEVLTLSKDEIYMRSAPSTEWQKVDSTQVNQFGPGSNVTSQWQIAEIAKALRVEGEETIDGVVCTVISFDMDLEKYFEQASPDMLNSFDPQNASGAGKIWIGKDDHLVRKLSLEITFSTEGNEMALTTEISFSAFNEPVDFPKP